MIRDSANPDTKSVFIVGSPRGGTTIVQSLLVQALPLVTVWETAFFRNMYGDLRNRMQGKRVLHKYIRNRLEYVSPKRRRITSQTLTEMAHEFGIHQQDDLRYLRNTRQLAERFEWLFSEYARKNDCLGWIEKTPSHVFYTEEIERYINNVHFIHIIRNGMDVVASLIHAGRRFRDQSGHTFPTDVRDAVHWWNAATLRSLSKLGQRNHFVISFDQFLQSSGLVIEQCSRFLGLENARRRADDGKPNKIAKSHESWKSDAVTGNVATPEQRSPQVLSPQELGYVNKNLLEMDWRKLISSASSRY
jgi:hypothetical protein